ncbi:MAG TPA: YihY/virulence factor BrkB family protein [Gaiellaceae bacterium]|jgi:membrane protein|nr:YihY/virulence factor BrkB family protein [Gaiellaceae bacterium]
MSEKRSQGRGGTVHETEERPQHDGAPLEGDAATEPQPEPHEDRLQDPGISDLSKRDYTAILKRSLKESSKDHITNLAAALAYYAFLAIPSALLIAVGLFGLLASPHDVATLVGKVGSIVPAQAQQLLRSSLTRMTQRQATGVTILGVGGVLALWSLGGAMQNLMWALNTVYDRGETRGFVRRRLTAFSMVFFALLGFALMFGVLVLGPKLTHWIGSAVGHPSLVKIVWWVAEWPLLVGGLLVCFAGLLVLGPDVEHPRWRFLSFGSVIAIVIWLAGSGLFAFYVSKFGSYNKSWGALSAVVIMLTWLWLSACALLFGAEIDAEAERSRELRRGEHAERELRAPAKA